MALISMRQLLVLCQDIVRWPGLHVVSDREDLRRAHLSMPELWHLLLWNLSGWPMQLVHYD